MTPNEQSAASAIARLSHDLRTPIATIQLIADYMVAEMSTSEKAGTRRLARNLHNASGMLCSILDSAVLETQGLDAPSQLFWVGNVVAEVMDGFMASAVSDREIFSVNISDDFQILGDKAKFTRVLNNLLANADKAVQLAADRSEHFISVSTFLSEAGIGSIVVSDSGIGIPPENLDKIWTTGFTAADPSSPNRGLGLAIVKEFVSQLPDGDIQVESALGVGTSFTMGVTAVV